MRIITTTHDYYDCIKRLDREQEPVYIRSYLEDTTPLKLDMGYLNHNYFNLDFTTLLIGFCGKVYPCSTLRYYACGDEQHDKYYYDVNLLLADAEEEADKKSWRDFCKYDRDKLVKWFNTEHKYPTLFKQPIWVCRGRKQWDEANYRWLTEVAYNCTLKRYQFHKAVNPNQAWQELSMWLGNIAKPIPKIPHMTDEDMASIKGFDKYSFRKDKKK